MQLSYGVTVCFEAELIYAESITQAVPSMCQITHPKYYISVIRTVVFFGKHFKEFSSITITIAVVKK